jgi:uncharacterized protein (UPF0332 family)
VTDISRLLEKAARSFRSGEEQIVAGDPDFAAARVYYGCLYVTKALLLTEGITTSSHRNVIAQYGLLFARPEKLDRSFHQTLAQAFELRQIADYNAEVAIDPETVTELIAQGRRFLEAASRYVDQL